MIYRISLLLCLIFILPLTSIAQDKKSKKKTDPDSLKKATKELPLEPERTFQLKTTEGTWMSLDISPDGKTIAFDMVGDIYLLPLGGGKAKRIIADLSFETHPKFSPDGEYLAFTSDRSGAENIWTYHIKTKEWKQISKDDDQHFQSVEWTPDGEYLIASRGGRNLKLHMYHKEGGKGAQLIKKPETLKNCRTRFRCR